MNAKSTWSLVAVAAIVFALIFFFERPYRSARSKVIDPRILPGLNPANVTGVQILPAGQLDIRVERTNGSWQLVRPITYPADGAKIENFLHTLTNLISQGHVSSEELNNRPNAQEEFGFDPPQFSIIIEQGKNRHHLLVGKKMAVGEQVFAQVLGGNGFFVIDNDLIKNLPQSKDEWRDHALANWREITFDTLKTRGGNNNVEFRFNPTNFLWRLSKPLEARADNTKVNQLLQKLGGIQVTEFVADDSNTDLDKFGLQTPELEIFFAHGTNDLFDLMTGLSPTNNPTQVFAKHRNKNFIFLIPKEPLAAWRAPYTEFRDSHLANLPEKAVDFIEVHGEDHFVLEKNTNNTWTVRGQSFEADSGLVQELLARLNITDVEVEKNVVTDFATYGLASPALQYTLKVLHPNPTNQLRADRLTQIDFGTNNGKIFAHRTDETSVYSIKADEYQFFPRASWQMRDRRIWNFDSSNVVNVLIQQKGRSSQLIRNAKGEWIIAPGSQGLVNTFSFEETIHRLGELKAIFWTARGESNLEKYGFKEADYQISLQVKANGKIETLNLDFGTLSEYRTPYAAVTLNNEKLIFEFPWPLYYDFVLRDLNLANSLPRAP